MDEILGRLPEWGVLVVGVVFLSYRFVGDFIARKEQKALAEEYRSTRPPSGTLKDTPPGSSLSYLIDRDRDREQQEVLKLGRDNAATMARIAETLTQQTQILGRLTEMVAHTHDLLERDAQRQDRLAKSLDRMAASVSWLESRARLRANGTADVTASGDFDD